MKENKLASLCDTHLNRREIFSVTKPRNIQLYTLESLDMDYISNQNFEINNIPNFYDFQGPLTILISLFTPTLKIVKAHRAMLDGSNHSFSLF